MINNIKNWIKTIIDLIVWTFKLPFIIYKVMKEKDLNFNGALEYINLKLKHQSEELQGLIDKIEKLKKELEEKSK
jgi:hypothetical protein